MGGSVVRRSGSAVGLRRWRDAERKQRPITRSSSVSTNTFSKVHPEHSWWTERPVRDVERYRLPRKYTPSWQPSNWLRQREHVFLGYDRTQGYRTTNELYVPRPYLRQALPVSSYARHMPGGVGYVDPSSRYRPPPSSSYYDRQLSLYGSRYFHRRLGLDSNFSAGYRTPYTHFYYAYYC